MAKSLSAFLAQNAKKVDNRSFPLSKRFTDENGKAMEWEITCITAAENQKLRRDSLRSIPVNGKRGQPKAAAIPGKSVQKGIGGGVVALPRRTHKGRAR